MGIERLLAGWSVAVAPYALALCAAGSLCVLLAALGWRRRGKPGGVEFAVMMSAAAVWTLLYAFELVTPSLSGKVIWAKAEYLGIALLPLAWFLFARSYTGGTARWGRGVVALASIPALTVILVATNELHGLVWNELSLRTSGPFPVLAVAYGPWFWVYMCYAYALLALGSFYLVRAVYRYPLLYRQQAGALVFAALAPWVGNALFIAGIWPAGGIDLTPYAFAITGAALALSMSRLRLFGLLPALIPVARNQLLETMRDGVLVLDVEARVVSANPAACTMVGRRDTELVGRPVAEIMPDALSDQDICGKDVESRFEMSLSRGAASGIFDVVCTPVSLGGDLGVGRLLVMRDITAHKQAEQALRESEETMRYIVKHDPGAVAVYDRDLNYIAVSDRYLQDYDIGEENIIGRHHYEVFPEMPQKWKNVHQRCLAGAIERNEDDSFVRLDGSITYNRWECRPWHSRDGEIAGIITYTEVITERKQAEMRLRSSEARYRRLNESLRDGFASTDLEGNLLEFNEAYGAMLGYERKELLGRELVGLIPEKWRALENDIVTNQVLVRGYSDVYQTERIRADGSILPVEVRVVLERDEAGAPTATWGLVRDITERLEAEKTLRERDDQLRQAQKMEAIGQLAGGIAHDFNNLLTAILGYSELILLPGGGLSDALRDDVCEIKSAAERASALTRQILAFSRRQALDPEVVSMNDIVAGMERLLRRTLGEDVDLVILLDPEAGQTEVDVAQFEQVLVNLALNSRDAMPGGGTLTIETSNVELTEAYCRAHGGCAAGRYVMLAVSDTGTGMDKETRIRAFEPFFTTKEPGKGTGLGLSTAYGTIKQSGGTVFVYSEPGQGTTIKVFLPRVDQPSAKRSPRVETSARAAGHETILVVEDETAVRELTTRVLTGLGYEVVQAASGDEALALSSAQHDSIDMLLTDVVLPGSMQGNEVARALVGLHPHLPVLYMSGYTRDTIVHAGRLDHGVNYLEKPFTPENLARRVREVLDGGRMIAG